MATAIQDTETCHTQACSDCLDQFHLSGRWMNRTTPRPGRHRGGWWKERMYGATKVYIHILITQYYIQLPTSAWLMTHDPVW